VDAVLQAAIVGLIQGLTEFIPISSSAHLELAPWLFGWEQDRVIGTLAFDVFLHLGTLLALLVYFIRDWLRLLRAFIASIAQRRIGADPERRLAWLLVLGSVPAAVIGFVLEAQIEERLHGDSDATRLAIAGFLVAGALLLWAADRWGRRERDLARIGPGTALAVGAAQALALLPGISRSGATIAAGLAFGLEREAAARFSFLLAIPITLGAGLYGSRHLFAEPLAVAEWGAVAVGFVVAAASGAVAIAFLLRWLRTRSVGLFAAYRVAFAVVVAGLVLAGR
jgi:undecaprenyl-diphosphatase